jgi:hypothetical protein
MTQWKTLRVFLLFCLTPITVYFTHVYTEGLFLCVTVASLYFLQRKQYGLAATFGFLASLTRLLGALTIIPFMLSVLTSVHWKLHPKPKLSKNFFIDLLLGCFIPLGFAVYLLINWKVFGNPLHYQLVLRDHWYKEVANPITMYWQHAKTLSFDQQFPTFILDTLLTLLTPLILLVYVFVIRGKDRLPWGWILWILGIFIVVASQSFWLSNARYLLLALPLYPILESLTWKFKPAYIALLLAFGVMAWYGIAQFALGAWLY